MARSKSFFGLRRGSTKSLTFSVLDGQQITKDRVSEVKNPRSIQQMKQRCMLKTAALGYSAMKAIVDHSFEGYTYGSQSMRRFMRINTPLVMSAAGAINQKFGYAAFGDSSVNMGQFAISEGSLSPIPSNAVTLAFGANTLSVTYNGGGDSISALASSLGCNLGDIATVCALCQNSAGDVKFVWLRLILPASDGIVSADTVKFESDIKFSVNYAGGLVATVTFDEVDAIGENSAALYGIIRSQKGSDKWFRSKAYLDTKVGLVRYLDDFNTALMTYPQGQPFILNGDNIGGEEVAPLPTYDVSVTNDTVAVIAGAGAYKEGATVNLSATNIPALKSGKWSGVPTGDGTTTTKVGAYVSFVMPAAPVQITFSVEDVQHYSIADTNVLNTYHISITPYEGVAEGEEVILACETEEVMIPSGTGVWLVNANTDEKWKEVPSSLFEGNRMATWSFQMPAFNLKVKDI